MILTPHRGWSGVRTDPSELNMHEHNEQKCRESGLNLTPGSQDLAKVTHRLTSDMS